MRVYKSSERMRINSRRYYRENREKVMAYHLQKKFGLSAEQYEAMHNEQNGLCAICLRPERSTRNGVLRKLCVDHCHKTNKIRGLLCKDCNTAIGLLEENVEAFHRAAEYVRNDA